MMDPRLFPSKVIDHPNGNVMHALKKSDSGFVGFGEAYFSIIAFNKTKGWKRHKKMTMNLLVPVGKIKIVLIDDRDYATSPKIIEHELSSNPYQRLYVPPMIWMGFQGISMSDSMLLNVASIEHDPQETDSKELGEFDYLW